MKSIAITIAIWAILFSAPVWSRQERPPVLQVLKEVLHELDTSKQEFWVPHGTPNDPACKAFWKLSSYEQLQKRAKEARVQDQSFAKLLSQRIQGAAIEAMELLLLKEESGEKLGCGGPGMPDEYILSTVRSALPKRAPPERISRK